ncbi:MAG: branched-chain amino acid ABC transporter permease [Actinomycetes bacterium]
MPETSTIFFLLVDGLIWGCIVALIALGLSLIFGIMNIINMAHGDLFMLGAVISVLVFDRLGSIWPALLIAPLILGIVALPTERYVLRPFEQKPLNTLIATLGLSFIIQQLVLMTWGGRPRRVPAPVEFTVDLFGVVFPGYRLVAGGLGLVLLGLLWLVVYKTSFGVKLRATIDQPEVADAMGIDTSRIRMLTFGLGVALAAAGGVLAAPIRNVFFLMGFDVMLMSFIVVIVGGLGNLLGTLVAALVLSGTEGFLSAFLAPVSARIVILILMAAVVVFRPRGLFSS